MKKVILAAMLLLPLSLMAQGNWERPDAGKQGVKSENKSGQSDEYQYAKYLGHVVPEVDGMVVWDKTFTNDKSADENYTTMLNFLTAMTEEDCQIKGDNGSKVSLVNVQEHKIVAQFQEWLVFKSALLSLDQTRFIYTMMAECFDNKVRVKIFRISYWYEENRKGGERFKAEEWITDKYAVNKKGTKLSRISGKFRRKTVDRVEEIYNNIGVCLNAK